MGDSSNHVQTRTPVATLPRDGVYSLGDRAQWYAIYTRSRHEKVVERLLRDKGLETFLPLREVKVPLSPWRSRTAHLPLFPGYLFSRFILNSEDYNCIRSTTGVVYVVGSGNEPIPIPDQEIESVGILVGHKIACEPFPYLKVGRTVIITEGPLRGLTGQIVRRKAKEFFVVSVELLGRAVAVELKGSQLEPWIDGLR